MEAANEIKKEQIPLLVGCTKKGLCNEVRRMPRSLSDFTEAPAVGGCKTMAERAIGRFAPPARLEGFVLRQMVPPGLRYEVDSALPRATVEDVAGATRLTWEWSGETASGAHTVTYRVHPLEPGTWTIDGDVTLIDPNNQRAMAPMAGRVITATGPCGRTATPPPPPTDTPPPPPTPTDVPTATDVPLTDTPEPTATDAPTPKPGPLYLPLLLREHCKPDERLGDIVLVMDMSTSMRRDTADGVVKEEAALTAARAFIDRLDFTPNALDQHDQVAVVGFNNVAWLQQPLTCDKPGVLGALDALHERQAEGTRLDLAFAQSAEALSPDRRKAGNKPVIILLTDGVPNRVPPHPETGSPEDTVIEAAAAVKAKGITVYTIGFGHADETYDPSDRVNPDLLARCASDPGKSFIDPRAERLLEIYREIASVFTCPEGRHDWSKPWP